MNRDPLLGRVLLGRYRVVRRLAKGGMGVVYLARIEGAAGFMKPVVIKRIIPELEGDSAELMAMFVREARILSRLRHPGIAGIIDFAEEDGAHLMVLEYVHGYDVGHWRRYVRHVRGKFDAEIALHIAIDTLAALEHAHHLEDADGTVIQIVHRDISPSNLLVDTEGHSKLLDFGVARMIGGDASLYKTASVTVKGKIPYVSPEQLHGSAPSPQGDLYAMAVVLHELLVGRNEFRGNDMAETVRRVIAHEVSKVASLRDDVPPSLDDVLARALAKDPEARYRTAGELAAALRGIQRLTATEVRARLLAQLREDFGAMPGVIGVEALDSREQAWSTPTPEIVRAERDTQPELQALPAAEPERAATLEPSRTAVPARLPVPMGTRWLLVAMALLVGAGAALVLAVRLDWIRIGAPEPPEQVYIVPQPSEDTTPTQLTLDEPPPALSLDAGTAITEPRVPRVTRPSIAGPSAGEDPSVTLGRRHREIEACLAQYAAQIEGTPRLTMHFVLERDGRVHRARILPGAIESTPLGTCLIGVARSVHFAPQEREGVSFGVPVTVERH